MRLVSSARYQLSRVVVSLSDRVNYLLKLIGFAIRYFPIRRRIAKIFPNVRFRTYWLASAWGEKRRLCLTDPFPCPVSMLPEDRESWQWQEVKAFRKGEKAIDEFFKTSGIPFSEQRRRQATPILLKANPKHFVISVSVTAGVLEVQDGRHRLAIATMAGLETINVQVVYPPLHQDRAMYREIKRWGGVEMVFPPLLTPRTQSRLTFSKYLSTRTIPTLWMREAWDCQLVTGKLLGRSL